MSERSNLAGGLASTHFVSQLGLKKGRCRVGAAGLASASLGLLAALATPHWLVSLILLSLVYGAICNVMCWSSVPVLPAH